MATAIARLAQPMELASNLQPKSMRLVAGRHGMLISTQGGSVAVTIGDVSTHGCSIQCASNGLQTGQFVSVSLEDGTPIQAVVRWIREDQGGLEFLRALPPLYGDWQTLIDLYI